MRTGILAFGAIILIFSAFFYYIPKPIATPANPDGIGDTLEASLSRYWSAGGMILGGLIALVALFLPHAKLDPKKSPMDEYAQTSAGQEHRPS